MIKHALTMVALLLHVEAGYSQVLMEVPLLLELPGNEHLLRAWYDGQSFLVDGSDLFRHLQYSVQSTGSTLEALDLHRQYGFECQKIIDGPSCQISLNDVLDQLGPSLHFDETRLHLRASSVATTFSLQSIRKKHWFEVPGPHLFPQTRQLWGGVLAGWQLRRDALGIRPSVQMTTSALYGTIKADIGSAHSWKYTYDWPYQKWLTQVGIRGVNGGIPQLSATNIPLTHPRLQDVKVLRGQSTPHALIQAVISGEVVGQVQADANGNYQLNTPIWYGTTKMQIRTQSLGKREASSQYSYLLTPSSLLPSGKMYYRLMASPSMYALELQYGLHQRVTLDTSVEGNHHHMGISAGATAQVAKNLALNTKLSFSERSGEALIHWWRDRMQATASVAAQQNEFWNANLTGSLHQGAVTVFVRAQQSTFKKTYHHVSIRPEFFVHHSSGWLFQGSYEFTRTSSTFTENQVAPHWYAATGLSFARTRVLMFADHRHRKKTYGLEGTLVLRHQSLGFMIGWDVRDQAMVGGLSIQVSSAFGSLFSRSRRDVSGTSHSHYLQGSLYVGQGVSFSPSAYQSSAAELRIFEDLNGNSTFDPTEPILSHIDAQLYEGAWVRLRTGALYVSHLEPYQRYQVRILEASIRDPSLYPSTGLEFSFTADPGQRKIIHVPMQRMSTVTGQVTNLDRAPLRLIARLNGHTDSEIYRDGRFSFQLRLGQYRLSVIDVLSQEVLAEKMIEVSTNSSMVSIDLNEDRP